MRNTTLYNHYLMRRLTIKQNQLGWVSGYRFLHKSSESRGVIVNYTKLLTLWNDHNLAIKTPVNTKYYTKSTHLQKSFIAPTILKYNYVGKSYRVRFGEGLLFLRFNRAHKTTMLYKGIITYPQVRRWFKLRMRSSSKMLQNFTATLRYVRRRNLFTGRGLWCRRDFFYKKRGKVSAYR